jgi:hypothetical protein
MLATHADFHPSAARFVGRFYGLKTTYFNLIPLSTVFDNGRYYRDQAGFQSSA